jgi:hypothetical protein
MQKQMKRLFFLFSIFYSAALFSQTILNSFPVQLNKRSDRAQVLNIEDAKTKEIYVFATDNTNTHVAKFNRELFLQTRFKDSINNPEGRSIIGHSISDDGSPILYWATENMRNLKIIKYFLDTKITRALTFTFPLNNEYIITTFQKNNRFYVLSKETNLQHFLLYEFNNGQCEVKMFDLSAVKFENNSGHDTTIGTVLRYFPIEKIESDAFNSLDKTARQSKMYLLENDILLTFDYNPKKTVALILNLETQSVTQRTFVRPDLKKSATSYNSFFFQNKLLQIKANKEELAIAIKDFATAETIKNIAFTKNDTVHFKSSPFLIQLNYQKPQEIKNTARFLKQLSGTNMSISAFKNNHVHFITMGGYGETEVAYPVSNIYSNFGNDMSMYYGTASKMVYFDAVFDEEFNATSTIGPMAIDNLFQYLGQNKNITLQSILNRGDYYILGYYEPESKQYILRKFSEGYYENSGNPVIDKAQFSKPVQFDPIKPF